jgi:hypothetical protein
LWAGARRQREAEELPRSHSRAGLWDFRRGFSVHGDIQAVFDAEPPRFVEDEISNDDDLGRHVLEDDFAREFGAEVAGKKGKKVTMKNRRDSVAPFAGLSSHLRNLLNEGSEGGDGDDVKTRLDALEKATGRIEEMLGKLCEELDDRMQTSVSTAAGETGTMQDLDRSGTTEIDE